MVGYKSQFYDLLPVHFHGRNIIISHTNPFTFESQLEEYLARGVEKPYLMLKKAEVVTKYPAVQTATTPLIVNLRRLIDLKPFARAAFVCVTVVSTARYC